MVELLNLLRGDRQQLAEQLEQDIAHGTATLLSWSPPPMASSTRPTMLTTAHHFANVLFNIMRGGIFVDNDLLPRPI